MTVKTVAVTCIANDAGGQPVAGAQFTFDMVSLDDSGRIRPCTEIYQGFVAPEQVTATADANGLVVVQLFPNAAGSRASQYRVTAVNPQDESVFINALCTIPDAPCNLHEVMNLPAPTPLSDAQVLLTQTQAALAAAVVAKNAAEAALAAAVVVKNQTQAIYDATVEAAAGGGAASSPAVPIAGNTTLSHAAHAGKLLVVNSAGPVAFTVPNDADGGWLNDDTVTVYQLGTGGFFFSPAAGVTIDAPADAADSVQFGFQSLVRVAANRFARA